MGARPLAAFDGTRQHRHPALVPSLAARLGELFLLKRARATVRERSPEVHAKVRRFWQAARARLRVAERLDPRTELAAALPLYREGVVALTCAASAAIEGEVAPGIEDIDPAWVALKRLWPKLDVGVDLTQFESARDMLRTRTPLDAAPIGSVKSCAATDRLARLVERAIEPRTSRQLWLLRHARIAVVVVAPLVLLAWLVPPLFQQKSLALHKPVKLSSSHPDSMAPPTGEWVVNGVIERTYGVHTNVEDNPWISIDLEQDTRVRRIVVYNRGDGWFADCLPLELQVGQADALHVVARRDTLFTQFSPWVVHLDEDVRVIRLTKRGHGSCALSEVSVYSR